MVSRYTPARWLEHIQSIHARSIDMTLERVTEVLRRIGLLSPSHDVITVAGTNGKGSSVAMLESVLLAGGCRVGAYTSPHLVRYNERVRVDGVPIDDRTLCESFEVVERARAEVPLTYFEFGTAAALYAFDRAGVDVVVLEVGLGGRLDAVNALDADAVLITSVGIDHTDWLGPDREVIAGEKAGIMRPGRPAVCSDPEPPAAIAEQARRRGAALLQLGVDFHYRDEPGGWAWWRSGGSPRRLPRPGIGPDIQLQNAAGVVAVLDALRERRPLPWSAVAEGIAAASLPGRIQILGEAPRRILDVGHNPDAVRILRDALARQPVAGRTTAVMGMLADKEIDAVVALMAPCVDAWHLATLDVPRGADAATLRDAVRRIRPAAPATLHPGPAQAWHAAVAESGPGDRVVAFGSFYMAGDILHALN